MDMQNTLKQLSHKIQQIKEQIATEEATKTAFVLPFINMLGYDIFNPTEVIPEFTADIGIKKGEKVDYAILQGQVPIIIIECKHWKEDLTAYNTQLHRYFHAVKARFAILTNGIIYQFFTDLDEKNKMDRKPFLEIDLAQFKDTDASYLEKFHKTKFNVNQILSNASQLKYKRELAKAFEAELAEPSTELIKHFISKVFTGRITEKVILHFKDIFTLSINQCINDRINKRLENALSSELETQKLEEPAQITPSKITTTEEEIEGYHIIKSILRQSISIERIVHRDKQSYCGILLDDNNRKPICRFHFNGKTKYLGVFDANKKETKHHIQELNDIYKYATPILNTIAHYTKE